MASITKDELAKRLRIRPTDLVSREQAAEFLKREPGPMANAVTAINLPGFYNLAGKGVKGGTILYRMDWLQDYQNWFSLGRALRNTEGQRKALEAKIHFGAQDLPEPRDAAAAEADGLLGNREAVTLIERWQYAEYHRRIEVICSGEKSFDDINGRYRAEARPFYDVKGNVKKHGDPTLSEMLTGKAREIIQPHGRFDKYENLATVVQVVWKQVLDLERQWLEKMPR